MNHQAYKMITAWFKPENGIGDKKVYFTQRPVEKSFG